MSSTSSILSSYPTITPNLYMTPKNVCRLFSLLIAALLMACGGGESNTTTVTPVPQPTNNVTQQNGVTMEVVARGYKIPWAIEVINQEEFLFTERFGTLYYFKNGNVISLSGLPGSWTVTVAGLVYGGLMDVSLHPDFATNQQVYIAYVGTNQRMSVARFRLNNDQVNDLEVVFNSNAFSIGSRIAWQDNQHFYVTQGLGGNPRPEPGAQDLANDGGKIHRLKDDGNIPADNPVFDGFTQPSSIWSYGHRDPQGLYFDDQSGTLYSNEHGPLGGDEFNIIQKGANFGWPMFSYGMNYDRTPVSTLSAAEAAELSVLPVRYWDTFTIAPSSLRLLKNSQFGDWNDTFMMGSLANQSLVSYDRQTDETRTVLSNIGRVRDIAQLPGGELLIAVDRNSPNPADEGRIIKLTPL